MENLRLRNDCQKKEHIRRSHLVSLTGQSNQLVDGQLNQTKDVLKQFEVVVINSTNKRQRKMTDEGRGYRKEILDKK